MRSRSAGAVVACLLVVGGCSFPRAKSVVTDPDPSIKIPAIRDAVNAKDRSAARQLVTDLESDDPAVRFYAIEGLRRLTNEDFGYHYWQDDADRASAVEKWKQWLQESGVANVKLDRPTVRPP